jgi:hypothetical protein
MEHATVGAESNLSLMGVCRDREDPEQDLVIGRRYEVRQGWGNGE